MSPLPRWACLVLPLISLAHAAPVAAPAAAEGALDPACPSCTPTSTSCGTLCSSTAPSTTSSTPCTTCMPTGVPTGMAILTTWVTLTASTTTTSFVFAPTSSTISSAPVFPVAPTTSSTLVAPFVWGAPVFTDIPAPFPAPSSAPLPAPVPTPLPAPVPAPLPAPVSAPVSSSMPAQEPSRAPSMEGPSTLVHSDKPRPTPSEEVVRPQVGGYEVGWPHETETSPPAHPADPSPKKEDPPCSTSTKSHGPPFKNGLDAMLHFLFGKPKPMNDPMDDPICKTGGRKSLARRDPDGYEVGWEPTPAEPTERPVFDDQDPMTPKGITNDLNRLHPKHRPVPPIPQPEQQLDRRELGWAEPEADPDADKPFHMPQYWQQGDGPGRVAGSSRPGEANYEADEHQDDRWQGWINPGYGWQHVHPHGGFVYPFNQFIRTFYCIDKLRCRAGLETDYKHRIKPVEDADRYRPIEEEEEKPWLNRRDDESDASLLHMITDWAQMQPRDVAEADAQELHEHVRPEDVAAIKAAQDWTKGWPMPLNERTD